MIQTYWIALAWLLGLLLRSLPFGWTLPLLLAGLGGLFNRFNPRLIRTVLVAGLVGCVAWGYGNWRQPSPSVGDISAYAPQPQTTIVATVDSIPKTTRSLKQQVWVKVQSYEAIAGSPSYTSGRLYVTFDGDAVSSQAVDNPAITDSDPALQPGQTVQLTGYLYELGHRQNPGGFDFRTYLARRGAFAGLSARQIEVTNPSTNFGGWMLRQRIVRAFKQGLGERRGALMGGMVLGSSASQLPQELREDFRTVGLAHVTAASGFHVALLLGIVLAGTKSLGSGQRQGIAIAVLAIYLLLTGGSPSACRATMMGVAVVLAGNRAGRGQALQPLGLLLATAVLLTLVQPLWIEDVGFLLSFAATLGLMVSTSSIQKFLDFIPTNVAAAIATPLAAMLWTLPLQLVVFGTVSTYCLPASLITAPLVTLAVGSGLVVATVSLLIPALGACLAWPLRLFLDPLIGFVTWIASWPSPTLYIGTASLLQCLLLYGVLAALTFGNRWYPSFRLRTWQRLTLGFASVWVITMAIPTLWPKPPIQVVMLAAETPIVAIHAGGETALVNSGSAEAVQHVVLPYLRSAGIRRIDRAIALEPGVANSGWGDLADALEIGELWTGDRLAIADTTAMQLSQLKGNGTEAKRLRSGSPIQLGHVDLKPLEDLGITFSTAGQRGVILGGSPSNGDRLLARYTELMAVDWLWWNGSELTETLLQTMQLKGAIAGGDRLHPENRSHLDRLGSSLIWTEESGAAIWTPQQVITLAGPTGE